jgi:hypothetical protein
MDDFEAHLKRQPLRSMPPEWRREILAAARVQQAGAGPHPLWEALREWLWPAPPAWAGLAAAWMLVLLLQLVSSRESTTMSADAAMVRPSPEVALVFLEQRRLRAELLELTPEPPPPAEAPRPRSERRPVWAMA